MKLSNSETLDSVKESLLTHLSVIRSTLLFSILGLLSYLVGWTHSSEAAIESAIENGEFGSTVMNPESDILFQPGPPSWIEYVLLSLIVLLFLTIVFETAVRANRGETWIQQVDPEDYQ